MHPISCTSGARAAQRVVLGTVAAALLAAPAAQAGDIRIHGRISGRPALDAGSAFDLHVEREDLAVDYDDGSSGGDLRIGRLGIAFHETLAPFLRGGIRIGWAGLTQSDRRATGGLDPSGYFAELAFAGAWPHRAPVAVALDAGWRYTSVDDGNAAGDEVEIDWQRLELRPALRLRLGPGVAARFGATAIAVDGDERRRAASTSVTTPFSADGTTGAFAALDLAWPDGDGITLGARGGNPTGLFVRFEQRY